jgi:hypothetical protein
MLEEQAEQQNDCISKETVATKFRIKLAPEYTYLTIKTPQKNVLCARPPPHQGH